MYRRLVTKADREAARAAELSGFEVVEYPEADCVVGFKSYSSDKIVIKIFDGTAGRPVEYLAFPSRERAEAYVEKHLNNRKKTLAYKAERKQKKSAAGKYTVDESKPHFEVGRRYSYGWSYDGYDYCRVIRVVGRTACFVSFVYEGRYEEEKTQRAKVSCDNNGEYISPDHGFYWIRACNVLPTEEEQARIDAERAAQEQAAREAERAEMIRKADARREVVEKLKAADPYVEGHTKVTVEYCEGIVDHPVLKSGEVFSVAAAEQIYKYLDQAVHSDAHGYDKSWFIVEGEINGESFVYKDRYDLGDNYGGLIAHIRRYAPDNCKPIADHMEEQLPGGRVVNVSFHPQIINFAEAVKRKQEEEWEETKEMVRALTEEQLETLIRKEAATDKDGRAVAKFFLAELATRNRAKAIALMREYKLWEE